MNIIDYTDFSDRLLEWPEGIEALNGLPVEDQLRWFVYDEDACSDVPCEYMEIDAVYMHESKICGIKVGGKSFILGDEAWMDSESENNGAGYKTRDFYARLRFREPGPKDWWHVEGDTLYLTAKQPEFGDYAVRPWSGKPVRRAVVCSTAETVGAYVLANSPDLEEVTMEEGVRSIGSCAFRGCPKLRSVECPTSMTDIGVEAFYHCPSLEVAVVKGPVTQATFPGAYTAFQGNWGKLTICCHQGSQLEEYAKAINAQVEFL